MKKIFAFTFSMLLCLGLLAGCGEKGQPKTEDLMNDIAKAYGENFVADTDMPQEIFDAEFGIDKSLIAEMSAKMPMIGVHPDRVVIIKAAEGKGAEVETALNAVKQAKIENEMQYPMNLAKVQATKVVRNGDYVAFLLVGQPADMDMEDEAERLKFAEEQVKIAVDTFNKAFA